MRILIAGLTGTGKSSIAKTAAEYLGLNYISGSAILKSLMKNPPTTWESKEGVEKVKERLKNTSIDKKTDTKLLEEIKKNENVVVDSWVAPWIWKGEGIRVYLKTRDDIRVQRVARRDKMDEEEVKKYIETKDKVSKAIYKKLYKVDIDDISIFDLVIDTSYISIETAAQIIARYAMNYSKF